MDKVAVLLAMLFSMSITQPSPPERISVVPREHIILYSHSHKADIFSMSDAELNALSLSQKAKIVHISKSSFKMMTKVVNHEAGNKMEDKILVASVIWNRVNCKQYDNSVKRVLNDGGFYNLKTGGGSSKDKKAQLAILFAYRDLHNGDIAHNVLYFNCISYKTKNPNRYKKYKHVNNYFIRDTKCKCKWCSQ